MATIALSGASPNTENAPAVSAVPYERSQHAEARALQPETR